LRAAGARVNRRGTARFSVAAPRAHAILSIVSGDAATSRATSRIEQALARIEQAVGKLAADRASLQQRHGDLRAAMEEAVKVIDGVTAEHGGD